MFWDWYGFINKSSIFCGMNLICFCIEPRALFLFGKFRNCSRNNRRRIPGQISWRNIRRIEHWRKGGFDNKFSSIISVQISRTEKQGISLSLIEPAAGNVFEFLFFLSGLSNQYGKYGKNFCVSESGGILNHDFATDS